MAKPINLDDDSRIIMGIKGMWALIVLVFVFGCAITAFQLNLNHKIESLYLQNQRDHQILIANIAELGEKQSMYVLKQQLENGWIFVHNRYDKIHNYPAMSAAEELEFRKQIRDFLDVPSNPANLPIPTLQTRPIK
jgi:hypothetical protein